MTALRDELLGDRSVRLSGGVADPVRAALLALGARVEPVAAGARSPTDGGVELVAADARSRLDALIYDATDAFGDGGRAGLRAAVDGAWDAILEIAATELIQHQKGGKVVLIAPRCGGAFAVAASAALENLARTLSVEWARYAITPTMIAPRAGAAEDDVAELVCFLVSAAGDYFSGCRFDLR
jgi:NAD(P)-dependent dehydrogenase (short-subunit alcohol dehydrogenase family)